MIHRVSCVSAVQRFILSPDAVSSYQMRSQLLHQYSTMADYACAMYSAWNPTDNYGINASVYEV